MYTRKEIQAKANNLTLADLLIGKSPIPGEFKQRLYKIGRRFNVLDVPINRLNGELPKEHRLEIRQWMWVFIRRGGLQLLDRT